MIGIEVVIVEGPGAGSGRVLDGDGAIAIGRSSRNDIAIDGNLVSRFHARIELSGSVAIVTDLESQNGIELNGTRVASGELRSGDRIKIGEVTIEFRFVEPVEGPSTAVVARERASTELPPRVARSRKNRPDLWETPRPPAIPPLPEELLGRRMGPYRLLEVRGSGGSSVVFLSRHEESDETVAVKVLSTRLSNEEELRLRFAREARLSRDLVHPGIVRFLDAGVTEDGLCYIATEFVEGRSVEEILRDAAPLPVGRAVGWAIDVSEALAFAHSRPIIHRDVKPGNVVIERQSDRARLLDFGLARFLDADGTRLTATGEILGTFQFISPEQLEDTKSADARADVYGLGALLYAMLTGLPPFTGETRFVILQRVLATLPRPVAELRPDVPGWLARIVERALAKDPAARQQTMEEMLGELHAGG
ncbi:MAG: protein kinase [Planctomycetes bacterium]|nr:protein kinase [Planctomycetota bacterium]